MHLSCANRAILAILYMNSLHWAHRFRSVWSKSKEKAEICRGGGTMCVCMSETHTHTERANGGLLLLAELRFCVCVCWIKHANMLCGLRREVRTSFGEICSFFPLPSGLIWDFTVEMCMNEQRWGIWQTRGEVSLSKFAFHLMWFWTRLWSLEYKSGLCFRSLMAVSFITGDERDVYKLNVQYMYVVFLQM